MITWCKKTNITPHNMDKIQSLITGFMDTYMPAEVLDSKIESDKAREEIFELVINCAPIMMEVVAKNMMKQLPLTVAQKTKAKSVKSVKSESSIASCVELCKGFTKSGKACVRKVNLNANKSGYCTLHKDQYQSDDGDEPEPTEQKNTESQVKPKVKPKAKPNTKKAQKTENHIEQEQDDPQQNDEKKEETNQCSAAAVKSGLRCKFNKFTTIPEGASSYFCSIHAKNWQKYTVTEETKEDETEPAQEPKEQHKQEQEHKIEQDVSDLSTDEDAAEDANPEDEDYDDDTAL